MSEKLTPETLANRLEQFKRILEGARKHDNNKLNVWSTDPVLVGAAASALRRLAAAGEQKPVGYRCRHRDKPWFYSNTELTGDGAHLYTVEPLYPAPQPAPGWDEAIIAANQLVGCLWSDLFNKDLVKAEGADYFDRWRDRIKALRRSSQSTSDAGGGVRVKPLEWYQHRDGETKRYEGIAAIGNNYTVSPAWWGAQNKWGWVGNGEFHHSDGEAMSACNDDYKARILSALSTPAAADSNASADDYRDAIDEALVVRYLGIAKGNPKAELDQIISWEVDVNLDPAVSSRAQALIDQGRNARAETITEDDIRAHVGDGMVSMQNVIDAANGILASRASAEARLREALEPFERLADTFNERLPDTELVREYYRDDEITVGDLRRAREALSPDPHASDCAEKAIYDVLGDQRTCVGVPASAIAKAEENL